MGSPAAGRSICQNSKVFPGKSSSTKYNIEGSSSPGNGSLKGNNKILEQVEGIIISPTHSGVIEDVTLDQDSRQIQNSSNVARPFTNMIKLERNEVLRKYLDFKKFDIVDDYSDHHYKVSNSENIQPTRDWAKKIQQEWRILEKNLPDMIFVRVYESRMDLLRAVIIGAEGTPYHDGLFFFDVCFPYRYPSVPPKVHYHSGGLTINPNLYNTGKLCLSLLNTWNGDKNERWTPGLSTMLQVLVSIQGLVLNAKPYFNDPWFAYSSSSNRGKYSSMRYNERTLICSLKTMVYTMKNPPKHFEDLVIGHFRDRGATLLTICKDYITGVRDGYGVNGGEAKVSHGFRKNVELYMRILLRALQAIGVDNVDESIPEFVPEFVPQTRNLAQKIWACFCIKE